MEEALLGHRVGVQRRGPGFRIPEPRQVARNEPINGFRSSTGAGWSQRRRFSLSEFVPSREESGAVEWYFEIESASPDDVYDESFKASIERCLNYLGKETSKGSCDCNGWAVGFLVKAEDLREAWQFAMERAFHAVVESGLPGWQIVRVSVSDSDYAAATGGW
jgi:hypothetical protein